MLVVDDNNVKLLRMKEKILEVSSIGRSQNLADYKNLAITIDKEVYDAFISRIKNTNYHNLPFNEQMEFLLDIEQEYNNINELQYRFKNVYYKYAENTDGDIELSNLGNVFIDNIRDKISNIQGYLLNSEKLETNRNELDKFNLQLVTFEKQKIELQNKFLSMEKDLKYDFVRAEGRKVINGVSSYASAISEYSDNGYDLRNLISNHDELKEKISKALDERNALEERLMAARICYKSLPNEENGEIYNSINNEMLMAGYHLTLLQMADLIGDEKTNFDDMVQKREYLKAFNDLRIDCLSKLGVKFLVDPFARMKIDSQLAVIKGYEDVNEKVVVLRRRIANLSTVIEERMVSNSDYIIKINAKDNFIKDTLSFEKVKKENAVVADRVVDTSSNIDNTSKEEEENVNTDNLVIAIDDLRKDFALAKALEKTNSVISRVSKLFVDKAEKVVTPEIPNLMIQESLPDVSYYRDSKEEQVKRKKTVKIEKEVNSDELFEEVNPFEEVPLFKEKFDDSIFTSLDDTDMRQDNDIFVYNEIDEDNIFTSNNKVVATPQTTEAVSKDAAMPDMFWVTKDDPVNVDNGELSFDEQIDKLISSENENVSRRKK